MRSVRFPFIRMMLFIAAIPLFGAKTNSGYKLTKRIAIGGDGGWNYLTFDSASRRLFVARANRVVVLKGPAVWVYRWRECGHQEKSVHKSLVVGTIEKLKTKAQALKAAEGNRLKVNHESAATRETTFGALIDRFIIEERIRESKIKTA